MRTHCEIHHLPLAHHTVLGQDLCPVRGCFRGTLESRVLTPTGMMVRTMSREGKYAWKPLRESKGRCRPCEERKRLYSV